MPCLIYVLFAVFLLSPCAVADAPTSFSTAKVIAKEQIFIDQASGPVGDLYCGCDWEWLGRSGGRIDAGSCGYETRAQQVRAERIEWEHIVPAWTLGHQRQCWQSGGRRNCVSSDPVFRAMEADLFNLYPSVGEVNGDRSNYNYGMVSGVPPQYGACATKVDFKGRSTEPRDEVKGLVARVTFYMFDRYGLNMSRQQQQLLMAWSRQHPVSAWEQEWNTRTAGIMGHPNPFVTGDRTWSLGYKPSRDGVVIAMPAVAKAAPVQAVNTGAIIGNRNSKVYHLPQGCPSYSLVSPRNQVPFSTEAEASAAGYRKAGNCR
tara:strand:+ start:444 stop:1394 length:951 start_codon:yes stop_codon:yes gene_type:complete